MYLYFTMGYSVLGSQHQRPLLLPFAGLIDGQMIVTVVSILINLFSLHHSAPQPTTIRSKTHFRADKQSASLAIPASWSCQSSFLPSGVLKDHLWLTPSSRVFSRGWEPPHVQCNTRCPKTDKLFPRTGRRAWPAHVH